MRRLVVLLVVAVGVASCFPQFKKPDQSPATLSKSPTKGSYSCYFDWDCRGGMCCSTIIPGCIGYCIACAQARSLDLPPATPKCIEDFDCPGGFCCSALQPGLEGDCVPCGGDKDAAEGPEVKKKQPEDERDPSPRCQYDADCPGGYCCYQEIPGLDGQCVVCGKDSNKDEAEQEEMQDADLSPRCQYDADCPGGYCCYQEIPGLDGQCVVCGKEPAPKDYCKYDSDCPEGFCCDLYYPFVGECKPCEGKEKKASVRAEQQAEQVSPRCQYDWDCMGGYCCSQTIPGLDGECVVCGKDPLEAKEYCKYDSDCEKGYCCDWYYPNVGECKPCENRKAKSEVKSGGRPTSPRCQYDWDCMGGYCCSQTIPGLDGECVVCGKVQTGVRAEGRTHGCYSHMDCPGADCCWQDNYGEPGVCVDCCL